MCRIAGVTGSLAIAAIELAFAFSPIVIVGRGDDSEPGVRLGKSGVEGDRTLDRRADTRGTAICASGPLPLARIWKSSASPACGKRETRIERNRLLVASEPLREPFA